MSVRRGLGDLRDLGRLETDDLGGDPLGRGGDLGERVAEVAQPVARRVPVDVRAGEAEPPAERLLNRGGVLAEGGERPGGTASCVVAAVSAARSSRSRRARARRPRWRP